MFGRNTAICTGVKELTRDEVKVGLREEMRFRYGKAIYLLENTPSESFRRTE